MIRDVYKWPRFHFSSDVLPLSDVLLWRAGDSTTPNANGHVGKRECRELSLTRYMQECRGRHFLLGGCIRKLHKGVSATLLAKAIIFFGRTLVYRKKLYNPEPPLRDGGRIWVTLCVKIIAGKDALWIFQNFIAFLLAPALTWHRISIKPWKTRSSSEMEA